MKEAFLAALLSAGANGYDINRIHFAEVITPDRQVQSVNTVNQGRRVYVQAYSGKEVHTLEKPRIIRHITR